MLWGAMNNASMAMMANSWDLGSISQNISNVNTTGYKRKETLFKTVMSESKAGPSTSSGKLNIFGVQTADRTHITAQGMIAASAHSTDLAINGNGFFMVGKPQGNISGTTYSSGPASAYSVDTPGQVMYTRAGNFYTAAGPNKESYFMANGGNYLLGWMPDKNGVIDTSGSLTPVYSMPDTLMEGRATSTATVTGNLPANAALSPSSFSTTQNIVDPNTGTSYTMDLAWQRVNGTDWTVTPSTTAAGATITGGPFTIKSDVNGVIYQPAPGADGISVSWGSGPLTTTQNLLGPSTHSSTATFYDPKGTSQTANLTWTRVSGNLWDVTATLPAGVGTVADSTVRVAFDGQGRMISPSTGNLPFVVDWDDATYNTTNPEKTAMTSEVSLYTGNNLPANTLTRPDVHTEKLSTQVWDSSFQGHDATLAFERVGPNQWYVHSYSTASGYPDTPPTPVLVTFNGKGVLSGNSTIDSSWTWTDSLVQGEGSAKTTVAVDATATVTFDFGELTQFSSSGAQGAIDQNGYGQGSLVGAYFNDQGVYTGQYTNGETQALFKVAFAQFVSENSLESISGTLFRRSAGAGEVTVSGVEDAKGDASFATSSLETSNVDIGEEFTKMIVTQKAYSTNATVFKTADEMISVARDLKA